MKTNHIVQNQHYFIYDYTNAYKSFILKYTLLKEIASGNCNYEVESHPNGKCSKK